jgi:hypothetical protein
VPNPTIYQIAAQLNRQAAGYAIGKLQEIRAQLKGRRTPTRSIFTKATISEDWAFHLGGRSELQFNIGLETLGGVDYLRHGVAFSLETSRTLPSIDILVPKIKLFNEFLGDNGEALSEFDMWHWMDGKRSDSHLPFAVSADLIRPKTFIFLGSLQPIAQVDHAKILADFDLLLPLYKFVESEGTVPPYKDTPATFTFRAGNRAKKSSTAFSSAERQLSVTLRHNVLQEELYSQLCVEYGAENVGTEIISGSGGRIDVVVEHGESYTFFEIKVGRSLQGCMREAIGQLLEYSYWPHSRQAISLIVAGEPALDSEGREFLEKLQHHFSIPIGYRQIVCNEVS